MENETQGIGPEGGSPSPARLGSAVCCPMCGKMPTLQNEYHFCDMRLYHCCRHQPTNYLFMVEFKAVLFTSGAITENELVEKLVNSWNAYCAQNTKAEEPL